MYSLSNEYVRDIEDSDVRARLDLARDTASSFLRQFNTIRLDDTSSINHAYDAAISTNLFDLAEETRNLVFGNITTTYGVSYISDSCVSGCTYCPIKCDSVDEEPISALKDILLRWMSLSLIL